MGYGKRFVDDHALLADIGPGTFNSEQETAWLDMQGYERVVVILKVASVTTTLDLDIEIATGSGGENIHTLKSITQLDDAGRVAVEIRSEEFSKPSGASGTEYRYLRVEVTPSGDCDFDVTVIGYEPRYATVSQAIWDEIVN